MCSWYQQTEGSAVADDAHYGLSVGNASAAAINITLLSSSIGSATCTQGSQQSQWRFAHASTLHADLAAAQYAPICTFKLANQTFTSPASQDSNSSLTRCDLPSWLAAPADFFLLSPLQVSLHARSPAISESISLTSVPCQGADSSSSSVSPSLTQAGVAHLSPPVVVCNASQELTLTLDERQLYFNLSSDVDVAAQLDGLEIENGTVSANSLVNNSGQLSWMVEVRLPCD